MIEYDNFQMSLKQLEEQHCERSGNPMPLCRNWIREAIDRVGHPVLFRDLSMERASRTCY